MMLFYRKYGEPRNPAIVVLHGLLGLSDNWDYFGKYFAEKGYYVLVPDMRNHGQSPKMEAFNYKVMARDVKQLLEAENVKSCFVIGHSMGGKIAMMLAFKYPQIVNRLEVLDISPRAFDSPLQHIEFVAAMQSVDLNSVTRRADVEEQLKKYNFEKRILLFLMKNLSYSHEHGFRWKPYLKGIYKNINEIGKGFDKSCVYNGPTLIIRGGQSDYIRDVDIPFMEAHLPKYEMTTFENSGHWIHVDAPQEFVAATERFLNIEVSYYQHFDI